MNRIRFTFSLDHSLLFQVTSAVVWALILVGMLEVVLVPPSGKQELRSLLAYFALGHADTIPAFISSLMLLLLSMVSFLAPRLAAGKKQTHQQLWYSLSFLFFLLSVNETTDLHLELAPYLTEQVEQLVGSTPYSSVLLATSGIGAWFLLFKNLFYELPARLRKLTFFSLLLIITGSVVLEAAGIFIGKDAGVSDMFYRTIVVAEEALELVGILFLLKHLLAYLETLQMFPVLMKISHNNRVRVTA